MTSVILCGVEDAAGKVIGMEATGMGSSNGKPCGRPAGRSELTVGEPLLTGLARGPLTPGAPYCRKDSILNGMAPKFGQTLPSKALVARICGRSTASQSEISGV